MKKQRGEIGPGELIVMALIGMGLMIAWPIALNWNCKSRWGESGFKVTWGPIQGCMLERKDGTRIPADSMRNLE